MTNTIRRHAMLAFAGVLALTSGATALLGNTSPVVATVKCKPDVRVTNQMPASIKVLNFKYKIGAAGTTHSEGLTDRIVMPGSSYTWNSQTLGSAASGVVITHTAVQYKEDTGSGYGYTKTSPWVSRTSTCNSGSVYSHVIN